jgi:hypothetical protein
MPYWFLSRAQCAKSVVADKHRAIWRRVGYLSPGLSTLAYPAGTANANAGTSAVENCDFCVVLS